MKARIKSGASSMAFALRFAGELIETLHCNVNVANYSEVEEGLKLTFKSLDGYEAEVTIEHTGVK